MLHAMHPKAHRAAGSLPKTNAGCINIVDLPRLLARSNEVFFHRSEGMNP